MMAADYRHIGGRENRLGRHYSLFSAFWPPPALAGQSLALRKLCDAGSNRRSRARAADKLFDTWVVGNVAAGLNLRTPCPPRRHYEPPRKGRYKRRRWGGNQPT